MEFLDLDKLAERLSELEALLTKLCNEIQAGFKRDDKNLAIHGLASRTAFEMAKLKGALRSPTEYLALCARNLFELNARTRFVFQSDRNLQAWIGEVAQDEKEIIEGVLQLGQSSKKDIEILRARLAQIDQTATKHGVPLARVPRVSDLAKAAGLEKEYKGLFKLYSKYVHPSSWIVNGGGRTHSWDVRNIFIVRSQQYAFDTLNRISGSFGLNENLGLGSGTD